MDPYRVILIDPDETSARFLTREFEKSVFQVFHAPNPKEGLILAYQNRPHVVIIDPVMDEKDIKELFTKFRKDWRLVRTKIFGFSSLQSPTLIQRALDLGFDEFITKEAHALPKLIELTKQASFDIRNKITSDQSLPSKESSILSAKKDGKTVVFLASKGGVGTSSLCANIAQIAAANRPQKIAVADMVLPIGSIEAIVGSHGSINIVQAAAKARESAISDYLQETLVKPSKWNFNFLAGSRSPEEAENLDITRIPLILEALRRLYDYVFVDFGKSLSRISLPTILSADLVVLTLSLDKTTVEQTKSVWEYLQKKGLKQDQIYFLINRTVSLEGLTKSEVEKILGITIQLAVPHMGRNFTLSNNLNEPIAEKFPQDAVTISLRQASDEMFRKIESRNKTPDFF